MEKIPVLGRPRRRELVAVGRKSRDPATALRFLMIAKLTSPLRPSCNTVAHDLDVAVSTVVGAAKRFVTDGERGLYDRRIENGEPKVDETFRLVLGALLYQSPQEFGWERPTWTRELLLLEMERRGFHRVAVCTIGRALRRIGARRGRPKPVVVCPWRRERRLRRLRQLRALAETATLDEPVLYADEVDLHLNPRIGLDWMPRGFQRRVVTPGSNSKRFLAGALDGKIGRLTWVEGERKTSELFCKLLWRLAAENPKARRIHVILDNYGIHDSRLTRRCIESLGGRLVLHFLPPYCPDDNKIERVWLDLHANVTRNHRCATMKELMTRVHAFLRAYNRRATMNPGLRRDIKRAA
jgi:transposase